MRILTIEEVLNSEFVYVELYTMPEYTPVRRYVQKIDDDKIRFVAPNNNHFTLYIPEYGEWWRCWSEMPTKEQQEAERWF